MAYGETLNPNRRAATLIAVSALHLAAGYALVVGLAGHGFAIPDKIIRTFNVPTDTPPPPPQSRVKPTEHVVDPRPLPSPIIDVIPPSGSFFTPIPLETYGAGGTGIDQVVFPTPTPRAMPSFAPVGPKPLGNPGLWVTPNDYPTSDLRLGHTGITGVALTIGASGRVENCAVTRSSGFASLDAMACAKLAQRARFKPGSDSTGAVADGRYPTSVKWEIPE